MTAIVCGSPSDGYSIQSQYFGALAQGTPEEVASFLETSGFDGSFAYYNGSQWFLSRCQFDTVEVLTSQPDPADFPLTPDQVIDAFASGFVIVLPVVAVVYGGRRILESFNLR